MKILQFIHTNQTNAKKFLLALCMVIVCCSTVVKTSATSINAEESTNQEIGEPEDNNQ